MKKRLMILLLVLSVALSLLPVSAAAAGPFPDVDENSRYYEAIKFVNSMGIMIGNEKGNFNPDKSVSRAEMATIVCRMLGETENLVTDGSRFSDVPDAHWSNAYVVRAASLGIINGYGDGKYGPDDTVTYEQAITMVVRAMDMEELAVAAGGYPDGYLYTADEQGFLMEIDPQPGEPMNRETVAQILYNGMHF